MTTQPVVSTNSLSFSATQPSSGAPASQACDSILDSTPPPTLLASASELPDSTCSDESLFGSNSDSKVSNSVQDVHSAQEKLKRTGTNHKKSNRVSNETKAKIQLASIIGATTLGAVLAPFTGGLSLLPTVFIVFFGNASALATYGGSEFSIGTTETNKEDKKSKNKSELPAVQPRPLPSNSCIPPVTSEEDPDDNEQSDTIRDRSAPGHPEPFCIFIDNSVVTIDNSTTINYNGVSSGARNAIGEGGRISVNTQTSDELFPELNQVGVEVTTQPMSAEQLRALITPSANISEIVDRLLDHHAVNGGTVITAQVSNSTTDITHAVISVPNEYLPDSDHSAASQTLIPNAQSQVAQPDVSGGWIRDENGWRELKETPRVFTTQGSTSARDAMWRPVSAPDAAGPQNAFPGSLLKSGVETPIIPTEGVTSSRDTAASRSVQDSELSTGGSDVSPQTPVIAAGMSKSVTSHSLSSDKSTQSQVAQPDVSGGWIRDENGWRELKETPRVFTTQGSTSARDAMWRPVSAPDAAGPQNAFPGSLLKSGVETPIIPTEGVTSSRDTAASRSVQDSELSTGDSDVSPQTPVIAAGMPKSVTSHSLSSNQLQQSVEKHYEVHIPPPVLTTEGTISGRGLNYSEGLFNNVKDIEQLKKQSGQGLSPEVYLRPAALRPIGDGGNRNNLVAAPVNKKKLAVEN